MRPQVVDVFCVLTADGDVGPYPCFAVPELQLDVAIAFLAVCKVGVLVVEGEGGVVFVLESWFGSVFPCDFPVEVVGVPGFVYSDGFLFGGASDVGRELREVLVEVFVFGVFVIFRRMNECFEAHLAFVFVFVDVFDDDVGLFFFYNVEQVFDEFIVIFCRFF